MTANNSPFLMPSEPKSGLDLLRWTFFEPVLLDKFARKLTRKESLLWMLRTYPWVILLSIILWIGGMGLIMMLDLPVMIPQVYDTDFLKTWQQSASLFAKLFILVAYTWDGLVVGLVVGLAIAFGTVFGAGSHIGVGLGVGFGVIGFGLGLGLFFGLGGDLVNGLDVSGIVGGFLFGLGFGLISPGSNIFFNLFLSLFASLSLSFFVGLGFIPAFYIGYFRLLFYTLHILMGFKSLTFTRNPYCRDGIIWLPLWPADKKLLRLAKEDPEGARAFINFLLEYRPLQKRLAARLTHAAAAGLWIQAVDTLHLRVDVFFPLTIPEGLPEYRPSEQWLTMVGLVLFQLRASQQHTQIGLKTAAFEEFLKLLRAFREQTLRESRKWNQDYLEALDLWLKVAHEHLRSLRQQAALLEPMAANIYRSGEALHPNMDANIFVGRDDLRETLAREILTARAMPMFLIQGQRRVGKTSLLNFLPVLLGPQFQVVFQDMQSERTASVRRWLTDLRQRVNKQFRVKEDAWNPPQDWLEAWGQMRAHLKEICTQQKCKIILAFDEYENFHRNFQEDPLQAEKLLGALRSFSQHQTQVVFLFTGAKFFSELQPPNWNEYFVQIKHLRVDYLKQADALQLIQHPIPDFNLVYPDEVAQHIFNLTQGHPALVQHTCSELVNLANRSHRKHISHEDVDTVLHHGDNCLLSPENPAIRVFWSQFCSKDSPDTAVHRTTLRQILAGQTPTDKVSLFRLEQHDYIVQDGDTWKMRVPLFDMWLRKYADILA